MAERYDREAERKKYVRSLSRNGERIELSDLIKKFGEEKLVNEHGIYLKRETLGIVFPPSLKTTVEIHVSQGADNLWRFGLDFETCHLSTRGHGSLPGIFDYGYDTKEEAILATADDVMSYKENQWCGPYIEKFKQSIQGSKQLSLF